MGLVLGSKGLSSWVVCGVNGASVSESGGMGGVKEEHLSVKRVIFMEL